MYLYIYNESANFRQLEMDAVWFRDKTKKLEYFFEMHHRNRVEHYKLKVFRKKNPKKYFGQPYKKQLVRKLVKKRTEMVRKAISEELRWQIVAHLNEGIKSNREIAKLVGVSEKCVRTSKKNLELVGSPIELPRPGRVSKLSEKDKSALFREVRKEPTKSLRNLASEFNDCLQNSSVSYETVRKVLKAKGIGSYSATRKPMLTVRDRLRRMKWCKERLNWPIEKWAKVMWSDESNYQVVNRKCQITVKRLRSEKYHPRFCTARLQAGGGSAGIWGCISHKGTGCCELYTGRIDQYRYRETLENAMIPSAELFYDSDQAWYFMQDGAPAHTAGSVKEWLAETNINLLPWCAKSPDLNPIESVWHYIDTKLAKYRITSVEHLKETLRQEWLAVPREMCMRLVESMPRRVYACYKARGGHFRA